MEGDDSVGGNINGLKQNLSSQGAGITLRYRFSKGDRFEPGSKGHKPEEVERAEIN